MKINWKIRRKNALFVAQIVLAVLTPILAYQGITMQDVTTWGALWGVIVEAVSNPYVLGLVIVSVWNAITDPTTPGLGDSDLALSYGDDEHPEFSTMGRGDDHE